MKNTRPHGDKRSLKYGGFSIAITVLVIVAVLALNVLATYVEDNNGLKFDFTPTHAYTLDKNAETAIRDLESNIIIYTFIPAGQADNYSGMIENIVALFDGASDKITSKNVDPIVNPSKLEQFSTDTKKLASYAVVVARAEDESNFHAFNESEMVENNSRTGKNYFVLQRWITSALIYLRTGIRQNVYILTGHGESTGEEIALMVNRIQRENFHVEEINLLSGQQLRQGDILVVLEPRSDLTQEEYNRIISFLDESYGRMLFMCSRLVDDAGQPLVHYNNLLDYFNLKLEDGVVAETDAAHYSAARTQIELVADQAHEISSAVRSANEPVWVSEAAGYSYKYGTGTTMGTYNETFSSVLTSYATSVLLPWSQASEANPGNAERGIHNVACAYERVNEGISGTTATTTTRILLMGSSSVATGEALGNSNILRNGMNWLAGKSSSDELVNVGIDLTASYVQMSQLQMKIWFAVLVIAVPLIIFTAGVVVWVRRKNL